MRALLLLSLLSSSAIAADLPAPPIAAQRAHEVRAPFGAVRNDEYYWLRDDTRKNPEMLANLAAENSYTDAMMAPLKPLQAKLYGEIVGRIKQDDSSVPYRLDGYHYYSRFTPGADYPIIARRKGSMTAPEQILLDQPKMAAGSGYFSVGGFEPSRDGRYLAYAEDKVGRRQYVLRILDTQTGRTLADTVTNIEPDLAWGASDAILYVEKDPVTLQSKRIKLHKLGAPATSDRLLYEEKDDTFGIGVERSASGKYVCIGAQATTMTEQRCAPFGHPDAMTILAPRTKDVLYSADNAAGRWIVRTNAKSPNYQLMSFPDAALGKPSSDWTVLTKAGDFIDDFAAFDTFTAIAERHDGNKRLRLLSRTGKSTLVDATEPAYQMTLSGNSEASTPWVRYTYNSLVTPTTTLEWNAATGKSRTLKVQPVPGYDSKNYVTERVWTTARDGVRVPVSLVYRKGLKRDGTAPLFQYAYGSYGASTDPAYSLATTSLLDRGVVYAIAHIRGGQEMGRQWFDDGHLTKKMNSFTDFIDVTRDLVAKGYAAKGRVAARGGSAGGLLMGGIANMAPADYAAIVAQVPFVDVLTTMLDASIPLTTGEYDQWGNPANEADYKVMAAYSPYDNVRTQAYPALFVSTGLWDSQVQYYEPAKWVARLRAKKTDSNPLLFR
ncbi:MAG: S9 family peptidase, partial [Sphingomicrobium sp.]